MCLKTQAAGWEDVGRYAEVGCERAERKGVKLVAVHDFPSQKINLEK